MKKIHKKVYPSKPEPAVIPIEVVSNFESLRLFLAGRPPISVTSHPIRHPHHRHHK